jgi:hypothetical protein
MKLSALITIAIFSFVAFLGVVIFLFWKAGIFKAEYEPSDLLKLIQSQLEFIKIYDFKKSSSYVNNLNTEKVVLPEIQEGELGRPSLFSNPY